MDKKIIHTVFEKIVEAYPNNTAVRDIETEISYKRLNKESNQLACLLKGFKIEKGAIVGVMLTPGIGLIKSILSIFKCGSIYLPIDISFSECRIRQIFRDCSPKIIIVNKENVQKLGELLNKFNTELEFIICYGNQEFKVFRKLGTKLIEEDFDLKNLPDDNPPLVNGKDDANYIFYTSGSTGAAKAILGCNKSLGHFINWEIEEFQIDITNNSSLLSQFTFDASLRDIFVALCTGSTLYIPTNDIKNNTLKLLEWMVDNKISLIHCVPSLFRLILKEIPSFKRKKELAHYLNFVIMAGEALYVKDILRWWEYMGECIELVNLYGTSETTLAKTFHRIRDIPTDPGQVIHVGKPINNTHIIILNGNNLCSSGEIGEIYIKTPFMSKGYYNNEALNNEVFVQNPLVCDRADIVHKTGDFGRYRNDNNVEVLGRRDGQVKVNGIRIELGEIISSVREIEVIEDADVLTIKNDEFENELVCYYTGEPLDVEDLKGQLKDKLNQNTIPQFFIHLEEFPLTVNGKKDKKSYPKPEKFLINEEKYKPPIGDIELKLEEMWKEILGLNRIGRNISFFRIGGNSMKVIQLISRIYKEYDFIFKYIDIFQNNTIKALGQLIANMNLKNSYASITQMPESEYYELSLAQQRLYVASQFEKEQIAYNIPVSYIFNGRLDERAFIKAFYTLVNRHESLRTTFVSIEGEAKQKISKPDQHNVEIQYLDLSQITDSMIQAKTIAHDQATTVFNLEKGPLLKASLIKTGVNKHIFSLTMHHIISDGWSMEVIIYEILTMYNAFKNRKGNPLLPLKIQYRDYAVWQQKCLSESTYSDESRKYWLSKFEGELPVLQLPLDFERPDFVTYKGRSKNFIIGQMQTAAIKRTCEELEVTLFIFLLTVANILLNKYTGQKDVILGSPIAGRPHHDLEDQIGFFVNMMAFRTFINSDQSFKELLFDVKKNTLEAYDHELYPFIQLVEDLNLKPDLSRTNIFDVVVQLQNAKLGKVRNLKLDGIEVTNFLPNSYSSKFDITMNFEDLEKNEVLSMDIEYKSDLFKSSTINKLQEDFVKLIDLATANTDITIKTMRSKITNQNKRSSFVEMSTFIDKGISSNY